MQFDYISVNYASLVGIVFLLIYLYINRAMDKQITRIFCVIGFLELSELIVHGLEVWTSTFSEPTMLRVLLSAVGYTLRPILIYGVILVGLREHQNKKLKYWLALPAVLNGLVAFSSFFTDAAYAYNDENVFVRGPLGYVPYMVSFFYLIVMAAITVWEARKKSSLETGIVFAMIILIVAGVVIEAVFSVHSIERTSIVLSTIFYYMYFQTRMYQEGALQYMGDENKALRKNKELLEEHLREMSIITMLTKDYVTVCYVQVRQDVVIPYRMAPVIKERYGEKLRSGLRYEEMFKAYVMGDVHPDDRADMLKFSALGALCGRIEEIGHFNYRYRVKRGNDIAYCEMKAEFVEKEDGTKDIVIGFSNSNAEIRREMEYEEKMKNALKEAEEANRR